VSHSEDAGLRIGASTWTYFYYDLVYALKRMGEIGLQETELWANNAHLDPRNKSINLSLIKQTFGELGLVAHSVHSPCESIYPYTTRSEWNDRWVDLIKRELERCCYLGVKLVVIHPYGTVELTRDDESEVKIEETIELIKKVLPFTKKCGIHLALENMPLHGKQKFGTVISDLREVINRIGDEYLGLCLDTSHCIVNNIELAEEVRTCDNLLRTIHVSDSDGSGSDLHLVPGRGVIDWSRFIKSLESVNYNGALIIEVAGREKPYEMLKDSYVFLSRLISG